MNFQYLFELGMKRSLPSLLLYHDGLAFDIGASGKHVAPGAVALGLPGWRFPRDPIPAADESVCTLHCYHFLEHLSGEDAILFLREAERVMITNKSVFNFCIPFYKSMLAVQDLTHKSFWCDESFRTLFDNRYYDPAGPWKLRVHFLVIAGIVERNLSLMGQLKKELSP